LIEVVARLSKVQGIYDRALAVYYTEHGIHLPDALDIAQREVAVRDDIYAEDTLAWAAAANGDWQTAQRATQQATRYGTEDALLHFHRGMIALHCGDQADAQEQLRLALQLNPTFHHKYAAEARQTLTQLTHAVALETSYTVPSDPSGTSLMKTLLHHLTWIAAIVVVFLAWEPTAAAHPLGNFTINHYAGLQVARDGVAIDYVLDMAEIPAFQERTKLDTPDRQADYSVVKCQDIKSDLSLRLNQHALPLALLKSTVEFPPGVGGLATLRLTCGFQAAIALAGSDQQLEFDDQSYSQRLGWREITVTTDVPLQGEVTASSITQRLTDYPTELLSSPLNQRQIAFAVNPSQTIAQPLRHCHQSQRMPSLKL
jgi:tetratricopeptide (TPR) repeat protein